MAEHVYLAVDLGASSGRVLAGAFDGQRLRLEEIHRFDNGAVAVGDSLYWDVLRLWSCIQDGLRAAAAKHGPHIRSLGVDTWGVDFALLGRNDELLGNPRHYRDPHTNGIMEEALRRVPREKIFQQTGLQFMQLNTLYQLLAMQRARSSLLETAETLLLVPDLFHWLLTGRKCNEYTHASTTQFYNPVTRNWAVDLLNRFNLPTRILGELVGPGTNLGSLRPRVAEETGLSGVRVVLPPTHDTASAVMAVPAASVAARPDWCYISLGTWALLGVETPEPVINDTCQALNFTNEVGVGHRIRLLKNITGLWLLQECRRIWRQQGRDYRWEDLTRLSDASAARVSFINPDDPSFLAPADMPAAIRSFCQRTGQSVPADDGAVVRCATESLALRFRQGIGWLEQLIGGRIETVHIVGGGTQNRQLCQTTADVCRRRVVAGPVEATAIGNLMTQAQAAGMVGSTAEAREVIRRSFTMDEYQPQPSDEWDEAYARFLNIVQG